MAEFRDQHTSPFDGGATLPEMPTVRRSPSRSQSM